MDEKYKFIGGGFINGVPARDLDQQDIDVLPDHLKDQIKQSGLYKIVKVKSEDKENAK